MKNIKLWIFILLITTCFIINYKYNFSAYLLDETFQLEAASFVAENYLMSVLIYIVFTILASSLLALPGASFAIISSIIFGVYLGSLYCLIGVSLGAQVSFYISRYLLRENVEQKLRNHKKLYEMLYNLSPEKELLVLMITRLLPIFPFNLQNFAYGVTGISSIKYFIGTSIFISPGILLFGLITNGFVDEANKNTTFIAIGAIIFILFTISYFLFRKYKKIKLEVEDVYNE